MEIVRRFKFLHRGFLSVLLFLFVLSGQKAYGQYKIFSFNSPGNECYFQYLCFTADSDYTSLKKPFIFIHRIILFHVLPDYASLYDEKISSSQNLTNPSTSITNGYGIFTGLNSDTLYIRVNEAAK